VKCSDIGAKVSKQDFLDYLNSVKGGQFFSVRGYVDSEGKVSDRILRFGVTYANLKARDIKTLNKVIAGTKSFTIKLKHNVWVPNELLEFNKMFDCDGEHDSWIKVNYEMKVGGRNLHVNITGMMTLLDTLKFSSRKSSNKTQVTLEYSLGSNHPLVLAAIGSEQLFGTLLGGLNREGGGRQATDHTAKYIKEAKSCYSSEVDGVTNWYLRDVLHVSKTNLNPQDEPIPTSTPLNAVKEAIRNQFLLTGQYRQFILAEGKFQSITIEGQSVLLDDEKFYFALPEDVKEFTNTTKKQDNNEET
jgi:hypothetical protein